MTTKSLVQTPILSILYFYFRFSPLSIIIFRTPLPFAYHAPYTDTYTNPFALNIVACRLSSFPLLRIKFYHVHQYLCKQIRKVVCLNTNLCFLCIFSVWLHVSADIIYPDIDFQQIRQAIKEPQGSGRTLDLDVIVNVSPHPFVTIAVEMYSHSRLQI